MPKRKSAFGAYFEAKNAETKLDQPEIGKKQFEKVPGKNRNPDYFKTAAYIRRSTYEKTKAALITERMEYSELIEMLLEEWLAKANIKRPGY